MMGVRINVSKYKGRNTTLCMGTQDHDIYSTLTEQVFIVIFPGKFWVILQSCVTF